MEATATIPPTIAAAVPRGWRSLLTGRWHRSSWVVAAAVLLFLVFCNVPGQLVIGPVSRLNADWRLTRQYEHGWPWAWAVREYTLWPSLWDVSPNDANCWAFWAEKSRIHYRALAFNFAAVVGLAFFGGATFELWRRERRNLWQLHLRDLIAIVFLVSMAGAWYASKQHRHAQQLQIAEPIFGATSPSLESTVPTHGKQWRLMTSGGITWLRRLLGDKHFQFLDRVIAVSVERQDLERAARLPDVRAMQVIGSVTTDDLRHLEKLRHLELLGVSRGVGLRYGQPRSIPSGASVTMPVLPQVRALSVSNMNGQGLTNLTALEHLDWSGEPADDSTFRQFAAIPKLQRLGLSNCVFSGDGLAHLQSVEGLKSLSIFLVSIDDHCARQLGRLTQLTELELTHCECDTERFRHLASLERLESLSLRATRINNDAIAHLARIPALQKLDLMDTGITSKEIPRLAKLTQLHELNLAAGAFSVEERKHLQTELPACRVNFENSFPSFDK